VCARLRLCYFMRHADKRSKNIINKGEVENALSPERHEVS
jgi:hypothetical protein